MRSYVYNIVHKFVVYTVSGESGLLEAASRRIDSIDNSLQETAHSLTQAQTDALFGEQTYNHTIYLLQQVQTFIYLISFHF